MSIENGFRHISGVLGWVGVIRGTTSGLQAEGCSDCVLLRRSGLERFGSARFWKRRSAQTVGDQPLAIRDVDSSGCWQYHVKPTEHPIRSICPSWDIVPMVRHGVARASVCPVHLRHRHTSHRLYRGSLHRMRPTLSSSFQMSVGDRIGSVFRAAPETAMCFHCRHFWPYMASFGGEWCRLSHHRGTVD